jgi:hypothetical protein
MAQYVNVLFASTDYHEHDFTISEVIFRCLYDSLLIRTFLYGFKNHGLNLGFKLDDGSCTYIL